MPHPPPDALSLPSPSFLVVLVLSKLNLLRVGRLLKRMGEGPVQGGVENTLCRQAGEGQAHELLHPPEVRLLHPPKLPRSSHLADAVQGGRLHLDKGWAIKLGR